MNAILQSEKWHKILLAAAVLIFYGNTVFNEYSLDDNLDIYENVNVQKGIAGIPGAFTSPFVQREEFSFDYRPVSPVTFCIEKSVWGFNPHASHAVNLLLYMSCVVLLYGLLKKLFGTKDNALFIFLALLIFAVHPLHTEVVASLKNRQELLSLLFGIGCLSNAFDFIRDSSRIKNAVWALIFLLLAYLTKISSIPFLGIVMLMSWFYFKKPQSRKNRIIIFNAVLGLSTIIYILLIKDWLFRPYYFSENPLVDFGFTEKVGTTVLVFFYYLKLLIIPWPMSFYYGYNMVPVVSASNPWAALGILLFTGATIIALFYFKRRHVLGLIALCFIGSLAIYNNVLTYYPGLLSDRAMFMPSLWFILFWALLYAKQEKGLRIETKRYYAFAVAAVVLVFGILSAIRNQQWKTTLSIMEADISHLENSVLANYYYGWTLYSATRTMPEGAERSANIGKIKTLFDRTLALNPNMENVHYIYGLSGKYLENNYEAAIMHFRKEIELGHGKFRDYYELGKTYFDAGNFTEAEKTLALALEKQPRDTLGLFYYAEAVYINGDKERAYSINEQLQAIAPQTQYPYINRGTFLQQAGKTDSAMAEFDKAVSLGCTDRRLYEALYAYYKGKNMAEKANYYQTLLNNNR